MRLASSSRVEAARSSTAKSLPDEFSVFQAALNAVSKTCIASGSKASCASDAMIGMTRLTILEAGAMRSFSHRTPYPPVSVKLLSHLPTPDYVKGRSFKKKKGGRAAL
jgi:hypothetical protein